MSEQTAHHLLSWGLAGVVLDAHDDTLAEVVSDDNIRIRSNDALPRRTNLQAKNQSRSFRPASIAGNRRLVGQTKHKIEVVGQKIIANSLTRESIIFLISTHMFDNCGPDVFAVIRFCR